MGTDGVDVGVEDSIIAFDLSEIVILFGLDDHVDGVEGGVDQEVLLDVFLAGGDEIEFEDGFVSVNY